MIKSDYQYWAETIVSELEDLNGVDCVLQFGEINCPGVSDLDFWLFFSADFDGDSYRYRIKKLRKHCPISIDCMVVPSSIIAELGYLLPTSTEQVNGVFIKKLTPHEKKLLAWGFTLMWLPTKLAAIARRIDKKVDVALLRKLYSLRYSFQQLNLISNIDIEDMTIFDRLVTQLRKDYVVGSFSVKDLQHAWHLAKKMAIEGMSIEQGPFLIPEFDNPLIMDTGWASFVRIHAESSYPVSLSFNEKKLTIRPIVINLPAIWAVPLAHWYSDSALHTRMTFVLPALPALQETVATLEIQTQVMRKLIHALECCNLNIYGPIAPLKRRYHRLFSQLFFSINEYF